MDCSIPGFPVLHYHLRFAQTHIHWVGDAITPSHSLSSPPPPAFNLSHLFQWVSSSYQAAKVLELQLQHQSFQWIFRVDCFRIDWLIFLQSKGLSRVFSNITVRKHQFFNAQPSLRSNSYICTWLLEKYRGLRWINLPWWIQRGSQFPECTKPCPQHSSGTSFRMSELHLCKRMISFNSAKVHPCAVLCLIAQSCLTLCNLMDCRPPGFSVHGILQARILERVAMPSRGSSQPKDQTQVSHIADGFVTIWATREAQEYWSG